MGLEIPSAKVPGTEVRRTPAERPAFIGFLILCLAGVIFLMAGLVFYAVLVKGANDAAAHDPAIPEVAIIIGIPKGIDFGGGAPFVHVDWAVKFQTIHFFKNEQTIVSFWMSVIFFSLFWMIFLYQRFFTDHVTIAKKRFRKWEDEGVQLHG